MDATTKQDNSFISSVFIAVELLLCFISYHTSRLGLDTIHDSKLVTHGVALGGAAFAFAVYYFLTKNFPEASKKNKQAYLVVFVLFAVLLFGFSTQWSAITIGGREAVSLHMQNVLAKSDQQGLALRNQGEKEASLAPHLDHFADQFQSYAQREAKGAFSGKTGEGSVVATARNTSETFRSLAQDVHETARERTQLYEELKNEISAARRLLITEKNVKEMTIRFDKHLSEINDLLTQMSHITTVDFVTAINQKLHQLTLVQTEEDSPEQKRAIKQLAGIIDGAQSVMTKITSTEELAEIKVQTFTTISMPKAVILYAGDILYAWAYALAIDLAPMFFILLLSVHCWVQEQKSSPAQLQESNGNGYHATVQADESNGNGHYAPVQSQDSNGNGHHAAPDRQVVESEGERKQ